MRTSLKPPTGPVTRRAALSLLGAAALGTAAGRTTAAAQPSLASGRCEADPVAGFQSFCFTDAAGLRHDVYVTGDEGPPILLLHELPGLIDTDLDAARRLAAFGHVVVVPLLFGKPGGKGSTLLNLLEVCGPDRFACGDGAKTSPQVAWLLELTRAVRERWPEGRGVGVVGMCLTGAFPIAMLREPSVAAAVLCQPTVPFHAFSRFGWFTDERALGVDPRDLAWAKENSLTPLLGIRYSGDWRSRPDRFTRLAEEFTHRFYRLDLQGDHHSTLAGDRCEVAIVEVRAFFNRYLRTEPRSGAGSFPGRSLPNLKAENLIVGCELSHDH